jgi:hypothetical protein
MCLNHGPKWETVKEWQEPNPMLWGLVKTYWFKKCCGKPMARYREMQKNQCKKCRRVEIGITNSLLALCLCCGYHFTNEGSDDE